MLIKKQIHPTLKKKQGKDCLQADMYIIKEE